MDADEGPERDWLVQGTADPREVAERYDAWAARYDADLDSWDYRAPAVVADLLLADAPGLASVLDVGCGTGLSGRALRGRGFTGRLVGLDISEESLRLARDAGAYDHVEPADLSQPLPVGDGAYDGLVCVGVMTYLPETESVWRELARVVRPGGRIVVTQREDLWEPRACRAVLDRLEAEGSWTAVDARGPAPYLPEEGGAMADLGAFYVTATVG